jgi:pseudaminic acid synthase
MNIAGREIGPQLPPYIVAEISSNHNGYASVAQQLIIAAKNAGADAVKLQAYTPDTITLDSYKIDFFIKAGPWKNRRLYELYAATHTPFEWFPELFDYALVLDIPIFASVFDKSSVDMLEKLNCPAYKIASMEITDIPLIEYAASTCKQVIISTGMASQDEILDAVVAAPKALLLHCVSGYPTRVEDARLDRLRPGWGISDHTRGIEVPIAATVMGAVLIEKHLCLDGIDSEDAAFSTRPPEFTLMVNAVRSIWKSLRPRPMHHRKNIDEDSSHQFRRSLYAVEDIKAGERFTEKNVRSIRPGYGLPPKMLSEVLMWRATRDIERGAPLTYSDIPGPMGTISRTPPEALRRVRRGGN